MRRNAAPINSLRVLINEKMSTKGSSHSILPVNITVAVTTAATVTTNATVATRRMMSRDVHVRVVTKSIPEPSTNNEKSTEFRNNVLIKKVSSELMHTDMVKQNRQEFDDVTTMADDHVQSTVVEKSERKSFKKKFPLSQFSKDGFSNDYSIVKSEVRYQDPIIAQEISKVDYLTSHPLEKRVFDVSGEVKHYENWEQPESVLKTIVVGNPVAKSMKSSPDDDDYDDK